jgi:magnesium-protoporphyrin IX monomethyl ester (oxidative) cyclase
MVAINDAMARAHAQGGVAGRIKKGWHGLRAGVNFARLYMIPTLSNEIPATSRLQPVW